MNELKSRRIRNNGKREHRKPTWFGKAVVLVGSLSLLGGACAPAAKKPAHPAADRKGKVTLSVASVEKMSFDGLIKALENKDHNVRKKAAEVLGKKGDKRAVPALIKTLRDIYPYVEEAAALALAKIGRPAVPALFKALKDPITQRGAKWALISMGQPAVPALIEVLLKDKDVQMRGLAAQILGEIEDSRAVPALTKALDDKDDAVRFYAVRALGKFKGKSVTKALTKALNDRDTGVRAGAVWALARIGDKRAAVPALISALKDTEWMVRMDAANALGWLADTRALPELRRVAKDDFSPQVREMAESAIESIQKK